VPPRSLWPWTTCRGVFAGQPRRTLIPPDARTLRRRGVGTTEDGDWPVSTRSRGPDLRVGAGSNLVSLVARPVASGAQRAAEVRVS